MNDLSHALRNASELFVAQRRELAELFGFETRNKYAIRTSDGADVAFAAEQQKGFFGFLLRQFLGHWRSFEIAFFDAQRRPFLRAVHPFRIFFQRLEIFGPDGARLGALQQRWSIISKRFDVEDESGRVILKMRSGFFRFWTFPFFRDRVEQARIEKKWSGLLSEAFTDRDNFRIHFGQTLSEKERMLILAASIFVDLQYFEKKASQ